MSVTAPPQEAPTTQTTIRSRPLFDGPIVRQAIVDSFTKLNPRTLLRNPVIFVVEVVSVVVTIRIAADIVNGGPVAFDTAIGLGLWFTVLFANFAEAMAEGRGKAQAETLRRTRADLVARRLTADGSEETVQASRPARRRRRDGVGRRADPGRRRDRRRDRVGRRVGDHRRVGPGDPGVAAATARP